MEAKPLIVERTYNAPIEKVWKAITDKDQMKEWYFNLEEFKAEKGFRFSFMGGDDKVQYKHNCEVIEVEPPNKLSHTWTYEDQEGHSVVTWELFKEGEQKTRVKLSHEGLGSFPQGDPNFAVASFTQGWNSILGESLKNYLETDSINKSVTIDAPAETVWNILLNPDNTWGKAFGGGAFAETDWKIGSDVIWRDLDGNIGSKGVITKHQENKYLQVDMYDDVNPAPGTELGGYSEKYHVEKTEDGQLMLAIEAGPISKKHFKMHAEMWDEALKIIKEASEK
jgi:uncharacterized protein YndB with AHSA1/START domain